MQLPNIYYYSDIGTYFADMINALKANGTSYRAIAASCDIASPGYLQRILRRERNLGPVVLKKIAKGFHLGKTETSYLELLNQLQTRASVEQHNKTYEKLLKIRKRQSIKTINDLGFYSNWINGVIMEMNQIARYQTITEITKALAGLATTHEIEASINYLTSKGYLQIKKTKLIKKPNIEFAPYNDKQRILDIQSNHVFFLNLAKHWLSQHLMEREFQGLTIAIPQQKFNEIKCRLREFITNLNEDYSHLEHPDVVYQIQLAAFKIFLNLHQIAQVKSN